MQSVLHPQAVDATPSTPPSTYDLKTQSPASGSQLHTSSHKKLSLSALKSPLKSLRSRRKSKGPVDQSPTTLKRHQSIFDLFHSSRSQAPPSTEALEDGIIVESPKAAAPAKDTTGGSIYDLPRLKRSKSFDELPSPKISNKVSSKYGTVSQCGKGQVDTEHHIHPGSSLYSISNSGLDPIMSRTAEAVLLSIQQERCIQKLETEMDTFWRQEQVMDNLKYNRTKTQLGLEECCAPSFNSWESSSQTLRNSEGQVLGRSAPKCEDDEDRPIAREPNPVPWLFSPKHSTAAPYDSKHCMIGLESDNRPPNQPGEGSRHKEKHRDNIIFFHQHDPQRPETNNISDFSRGCIFPAFRGRLAAKRVAPRTLEVIQSPPRVTNDTSIAERIELTVDEMTNNRYMNRSVDGLDLKFVDRILADSVYIRTPTEAPSTCHSGGTLSPKIDSIQLKTTKRGNLALDTLQDPKYSDIVCPKIRVEGLKGRPCSRKSRKISTGLVRVKFPDTKTGAAYIGLYKTSSEAISDIFEKNNGQLSSVCAYDRESRIIHVYSLQCSLTSKELRQRGLEPIWLPLQDKSRSEGLLEAMLSDDSLCQKNSPTVPTSASSSATLSGSQNRRTLMDGIVINRQPRILSKPLADISTAYSMLDESSGSSKHVPSTDVQTLTGNESSKLDSRTEIPAKSSVSKHSNLSTDVGNAADASFPAKINTASNFRQSPIPNHVKDESDLDDSSIFQWEHSSEGDSSVVSRISGSSEEYDKNMMGNESDSGCVQLWKTHLDSDDERDLHRMKNKRAHKGCNIDTWRNTESKRDYINKSPLFQRPYYLEAIKNMSETHGDGTQRQAGAKNSVDKNKYCDSGEGLSLSVCVKHNTVDSSPRSQLSSTGADRESSSEPSLPSGFPFTAYATQLLESGESCMNREHSDSMYMDEVQRPVISRNDSGANIPPKETKKVAQLQTALMSRYNGERQSVSRDLRYDPSNSVNVLPDIDEGCEIDGKMCPVDTTAESMFADGDKTLETAIPVSYSKRSCGCTGNERSSISPITHEQKNVAGLVEIFRAREMIGPGLISGLQRTQTSSNSAHQCSCAVSHSSTRIVTPSGAVYSPSGAAPRQSYPPSSVKRIPTPHSFSITDTSFSDENTEASSLFREQLGRLEGAAVESNENGPPEGNEWYFRDGQIYG